MEIKNKRILVVDDEEDICAIVQYHLIREGFDVDVALSAEEAMSHNITDYALIMLDVMMPGKSGFEMAAALKNNYKTKDVPIIFLTAMDTEENIVEGLKLGADDYIAKPFSPNVLKARVATVLRRCNSEQTFVNKQITYEGIHIDTVAMSLSIDGEDVAVTRRELDILILLLSNIGKVFSRQYILDNIWPDDVCVTERTVDVNITRLRKKLGRYSDKIYTRVGYGYSFKD